MYFLKFHRLQKADIHILCGFRNTQWQMEVEALDIRTLYGQTF